MSLTSIGTKLYMSKEPHKDLETAPEESALASVACDANSFGITGGTATELDRTSFCDSVRRYVKGVSDSGTASMTVFYEGEKDSAYRLALQANKDGEMRYFKIEFNNGDTVEFLGFVNQFDRNIEVDALLTVDVGIRLSGDTKDTFKDGVATYSVKTTTGDKK